MDTEDLAVDDGGEGEVVEDLGAVPPHRDAHILPQALVIEAVNLRDDCLRITILLLHHYL